MTFIAVNHYLTPSGGDPFDDWRSSIKDKTTRIAIDRRINRMALGNFGDHRVCRDGVWELRVDLGPGYRVYFGRAEREVVILLCGGDKRKQDADIDRAIAYWKDWQARP